MKRFWQKGNDLVSINFKIENAIATIEFDQPGSKVNLLTSEVMRGLDLILEEIHHKSDLKAVLITSAKKDIFIAGADIKEIEGIREVKDAKAKSSAGQNILNKLEDLRIPSIAVIDGVALGGGCELALACRFRVATFNEKVKIGLPEVNLGIIPGFGGTYRLPRLVGLSQSLKLILAGKVISGQEAFKIGLVDRLFPQRGMQAYLHKFMAEVTPKNFIKKFPSKKPDLITNFLERTSIGNAIVFQQSRKTVLQTTKGFYPAPIAAIGVIQKTFNLNRNQALKIEARAFAELAITEISKNLLRVFYLSEKYKKFMPPGAENFKPTPMQKAAVVGAGVMGGGIAQLLSYKGIWTRIKDINYEAIAKGFQAAGKIYQEAVKKRKLKNFEVQGKMAHITATLDYSGFKNCDVVIEAVVENMDVKKKIFKELDFVVSSPTILCTNTSALSVTEMAQETRDPSRVVGFHFFNPVHRMPLVEIIATDLTSVQTLSQAFHLARRLDKTPVLVKDSSGFLVNRILLGYINEAGHMLEEGMDFASIDRIVTDFGMPMGPFSLSDEVGLDVGIKVLHILEKSFGERFKPVGIFEKIYAKGFLGKKSQKGFYLYNNKKKIPNPEVLQMLATPAGQSKKNDSRCDQEEYLNRMIYLMINEAARCLEEKIVDSPETVDIAMIMGTGFPPFRGGLLRYAAVIGVENIIAELKNFETKFQSKRFSPCAYLRNLK